MRAVWRSYHEKVTYRVRRGAVVPWPGRFAGSVEARPPPSHAKVTSVRCQALVAPDRGGRLPPFRPSQRPSGTGAAGRG